VCDLFVENSDWSGDLSVCSNGFSWPWWYAHFRWRKSWSRHHVKVCLAMLLHLNFADFEFSFMVNVDLMHLNYQ